MEVFLIDSWDLKEMTNKKSFSDKLSQYQRHLLNWRGFLKQPDALSGEFVPFD